MNFYCKNTYRQTEKYSLLTHFHIVKSVCLDPMKNPKNCKVSCPESYETPHKKYLCTVFCMVFKPFAKEQSIYTGTKYYKFKNVLFVLVTQAGGVVFLLCAASSLIF